jgi:hypothetical protein
VRAFVVAAIDEQIANLRWSHLAKGDFLLSLHGGPSKRAVAPAEIAQMLGLAGQSPTGDARSASDVGKAAYVLYGTGSGLALMILWRPMQPIANGNKLPTIPVIK